MQREIEIGVGLWDPRVNAQEEMDPWRMVEVAEMADQIGFSYLAMPDRVSRPIPRFDTLTLMAALALKTKKIRFLTHVFVTPLRQPIELARRIVTVDHLSGGRFVFGAGLGGGEKVGGPDLTVYQKEFVDLGIDIKERGLRTDEILQILKKLWTEPVASFEGRFYSFKDVVFEPKPFQKPHPPIWVGGNTDAAMKRAAKFGDGWAGSLENAAARVGSAKEALRRLDNYLEQHGRSRKDFHVSTTLRAHIDPDRSKALDEAKKFWALQRGSTEGNRPFELKESFAAYGPAEIAVEKIQELKELGLDSLMFYVHAFDLRVQLRRIDEEILPRVL